LLDAVTKESDVSTFANGSQLLHACTLSSTTLILVGIISKIRSAVDQPLDRRKSFGNTEHAGGPFDILSDAKSWVRILNNVFSIMLPFYAAMQLGGPKIALVLLVAVAAGLGGLEHRLGKHSILDDLKRTFRTRKATCGLLAVGMIADTLMSANSRGALSGYVAISTSIFALPPPLPTAGSSLMTGFRGATDSISRLSLPKPSSPLVSTSEDTLLTLVAGALLTVVTVLYSIVSSSSPSITNHAIAFSTLSVASAAALIFVSLPSALRTQKKLGLALGCTLTATFGIFEHLDSWQACVFFPFASFLTFGAVSLDTGSALAQPHSHGHTHQHSGHKHSHSHDHHLHGNHSRLSAFIIARCTPGSIFHSIMVEKDSRRIAYFGMLNLGFMMVQFFYGFVSGSLGLLTDSIHMLFDCAGLAVGLAAAVMSKWSPNARFPYGFGKIDTLSGFANGVFLL
jgi:zinc transporter 5/7